MEFSVNVDLKKVKKGLDLTDSQMRWLQKRAVTTTARNIRVQVSKGNMGLTDLRRKKVIRARVKPLTARGKEGVWIGTNDLKASEFKGRPVEGNGGVSFRGHFFKGAFLGKFKNDRRRRILQIVDGKLAEVLIGIDAEANKFLLKKIQPLIPERLEYNIGQAVDNLKYVTAKRKRK